MAERESERGALAKSPQMCVVAGYTERAVAVPPGLHFIEAAARSRVPPLSRCRRFCGTVLH